VTAAVVELAGESVELRAERALYWPARRTLVIADLHVGKDTAFRAAGVPIPPGGLDDDLARLGAALDATRAERLLVLGDLTHSRSGLSDLVVARVADWRRAHPVPTVVIRGNHDRHLGRVPPEWDMELVEGPVVEGPFGFVHRPTILADRYIWAGHVHPVVRLGNTVDRIRLPCFQLFPDAGILPAFSRFTGGAVLTRDTPSRRFAVVDGRRVLAVP
jgi:DNA ligase-associated metallophosphoesterase